MAPQASTAETLRLLEDERREKNWKRWGPYLSERQWGTVREDYSPDGEAWTYFPHDHAPHRIYRWGEDGLLGFTDRECRLCFGVALWNGQDPVLKERLFGLTGPQGSHGEDVKECYYYLDSTPTHSFFKGLYKYPQREYPYDELVEANRGRSKDLGEFELTDTDAFAENRYFDVFAEYAKQGPDDILVRLTICNRGPAPAKISVLPQFWFRNTWIWGCRHEGCSLKPRMEWKNGNQIAASHETLGNFQIAFDDSPAADTQRPLMTENETNTEYLYGEPQYTPYVKDGFHRFVIDGDIEAVNPRGIGTKAAMLYDFTVPSNGQVVVQARLTVSENSHDIKLSSQFGSEFDRTIRERQAEADDYYATVIPSSVTEQENQVSRQAYAGLLWSKQFYHYIVQDWMNGDDNVASPPDNRRSGRNKDWQHVYARDIISMPDKWEYPWFAAWDLAFHMIPMSAVDATFAKQQLLLLLREWYMHPNGQLPAYEFGFHDVNPPVHAWACLRVYQLTGGTDRKFLAQAFQRLLLNFTWWVNQVDGNGDNVFAGGFLGLDNIGIFDRSKPLPTGGHLEQADGTAWMAFYCGSMLAIALELAREDAAYAEMASKFLDHFVRITDAINTIDGTGLWNEEDQFYYDHLHVNDERIPLKVRSLVGLLPLIAVTVIDRKLVDQLPDFARRLDWFLTYRHDLAPHVTMSDDQIMLAVPTRDRLTHSLEYLLDESEFLSPYGIRSLSRFHENAPYTFDVDGENHEVRYVPGESDSWMFGGNSNWRGPVWFPMNYLLIEALETYHRFFGDELTVECPTGSGTRKSLAQAAIEINERLTKLFLPNQLGHRPCDGPAPASACDPHWKSLVLFHEYFHADSGRGLGASHQTGWTALIASCISKGV
jgi:hypothetical protein